MSWFTSGLQALNDLSEKVQQVIPIDQDLLAKLTLNTDEMKAERQQFGEEANRKVAVKNMLAGMLPWETRDPERDILVEECKEAIMALSQDRATFHGPYEMPILRVNLEVEKDDEGNDDDEGDDDDKEDDDDSEAAAKRNLPSEESLEKLAKLEPLPPLLRDFDLDSHVGLIERLLSVDPVLAEQQSTLSGGGAREKVFWQNYFFHCAYTRYEAGLSIDEIWSFKPDMEEEEGVPSQTGDKVDDSTGVGSGEEVVEFDVEESENGSTATPAFVSDDIINSELQGDATNEHSPVDTKEGSPSASDTTQFEVLDELEKDDPELDELEAEILRELED